MDANGGLHEPSTSSRTPGAMIRRVLVVAYCFPPHAAVGTLRTLRLVTHLATDGWHVQVLTGTPASYPEGAPIDDELLDTVPASVDIVRAVAARGLTRLARAARPFRRWCNKARPGTGGSPSTATSPERRK